MNEKGNDEVNQRKVQSKKEKRRKNQKGKKVKRKNG